MNRLAGCVVATTQATDDHSLRERLVANGSQVVSWPTIVIEPTDALKAIGPGFLQGFDWIVFTSQRGVRSLCTRFPRQPEGLRVAAVGASTSNALSRAGWAADMIGDNGAEALAEAMIATDRVADRKVLFPCGSLARRTLEDTLTAAGAEVTRLETYTTRPAEVDAAQVLDDVAFGVDVVAFTSPSAVRSLVAGLADAWPTIRTSFVAAAIGRTTCSSLVDHGVPRKNIVVAQETTLDGLVDAVVCATSLPHQEHPQ